MSAPNFLSEVYTVILGRLYPKMLAGILYRKKFNKDINWKNPVDLNEKINWLAFNTDTSQWQRLADKYLVREYVKSVGHARILTKLLGVWDSPDSIDFEILPEKFVLKCTHDAGTAIVVENKNKINKNEIRNKLKVFLKVPFGIKTAEPHYLKIKRKIIAEEYIINNDPISDSLIDYKFWCINGKAHYCHVVYDKKVHKNKKSDMYSLPDWKQQDNKLKNKTIIKSLPKPKKLKEMIDVAESLSNSFKQCRVDLYHCSDIIYFGELTFTSACGRINNYTDDFLIELGEKIIIPF